MNKVTLTKKINYIYINISIFIRGVNINIGLWVPCDIHTVKTNYVISTHGSLCFGNVIIENFFPTIHSVNFQDRFYSKPLIIA